MWRIFSTAMSILCLAACGGPPVEMHAGASESELFQFGYWVSSPAPGCARAIGSPSWVIGCDHTPDGQNYRVYRLDSVPGVPGTFGTNVWNPILGSAATRIAVSPEGVPWIVDAAGRVFKYNGSSFVPILTRGCATDIGVGPNDSAWVIGCDAPVAGDRGVYYLVGSPASPASQWSRFEGMLAKRITVSPEGVPWVVNSIGNVSRRLVHISPSGTTTSFFVQIPTAPGECASSIGVGSQGEAWKLDCGFVPPYGYGIHHWNGSAWTQVPGLAVGISVEPFGRPSVINQPGSIFTATIP